MSLSVHELTANNSLRLSYAGMHTYRLSITEDLNQIPASTIPYNQGATAGVYVDKRAPYQNWTTLYSTFNHGEANYKALEIEGTHRMAGGLYYDANYTLAANKADNQGDAPSSFAGEVNYGIPITNRFDTYSDYGNVEGTRRHRFLLTGVYQLPFGQGRKYLTRGNWLNEVAGGWNLNTITLLETGPWLTPSISAGGCQVAPDPLTGQCPRNANGIPETNDQSNTNVTNRGAFLRPDAVSHNYLAGRSRSHYCNLAAFSPTPIGSGRFGNSGVGILEGPGTAAVSLGLAKVFTVTESVHFAFRIYVHECS